MAEIRLVAAEEMAEAIRGSDAVFRDAEQISMGAAFPAVFSPALSQSFGAYEDGKLVSFMGLVPAVLRIGDARVPMYSLGSVYTLPDFRGHGYAGDILQAIKAHVRASGGALVYVSGDRSLYTRNQCHPFGAIDRCAIGAAQAEGLLQAGAAAGFAVREMAPTDWMYVSELAAARRVAYEQSVRELAELIASEAYASCLKLRHRTLVATKDGRVAAFAVVATPDERGSKRTPLAVEWAGDAVAVAAILGHAATAYGLPQLDVPVAWHERELAAALAGVPSAAGRNLGTVHVADAERLFACLAPYWRTSIADPTELPHVRTLPDHRYALTAADGRTFELDSASLVSLLFDPMPSLPAVPEARAAMLGPFPVPLPYAGGLNYV
ncbi:GNAT family N-acetyltransferase [Paenibacillus cymbidii]|uniref:GNAT family N-acetyltransferase n=1 Tax=Paenibacillus cymbidii TaxID=1639034 RepID=UPI001081CB83|nr:GNAT family N-acetyltransferase [Paenibacillus cymbidii]